MQVTILDNGDLQITCDEEEQAELQQDMADNPDFVSESAMRAALEFLVTNHEYEWTEPAFCGALTDAPMLAIYGKERPIEPGEDPHFLNVVGRWHDAQGKLTTWVADVEKCWAHMDYQLRSPLEDLAERSACVFRCG